MMLTALFAALAAGIAHSPAPPAAGCNPVPVIALVPGRVLAGNFRDDHGGCYVWLNAYHVRGLARRDVCQLAAHEVGHLGGLGHVASGLMASPFKRTPERFC